MSSGDHNRKYGEAALQRACDEVTGCGKGNRNAALNSQALGLGHYAAYAELSELEVVEALLGAVRPVLDRTMTEQEARKAIEHGFRDGLKHPREPESGGRPPGARARQTSTKAPSRAFVPDAPHYPPQDELKALWQGSAPLSEEPDPWGWNACPYRWLESRSIDPEGLRESCLVKELRAETPCPPWAHLGDESWFERGYALLVPLWNATGRMRSVKARLTGLFPWEGAPKSLAPKGYSVRGLAMANNRGLELLRVEDLPPGCRVVIAEGIPDFLTASRSWSDCAVFGVEAGLWTREHASKVPDGSEVTVYTHDDAAGEKYAETIRDTFKGRAVSLRRG